MAHPRAVPPAVNPPGTALPFEGAPGARATAAAAGPEVLGRAALQALLQEHARGIATLCHHLCGAAEGRDAAQEALERIVRSIGHYDAARPFRPWAFSVARNVCRDRLRRRGLERQTFDPEGDDEALSAPSSAPDPERHALARADARALSMALEALPENLRAALVLFHFQDASYEEIATILEVPIGTVMTWIFRGRRKLRDAMEKGEQG